MRARVDKVLSRKKNLSLLVLSFFLFLCVTALNALEYRADHELPGIEATREVVMGYLTPVDPRVSFNSDYVTEDVIHYAVTYDYVFARNRWSLDNWLYLLTNFYLVDGVLEDIQLTVGNGRAVVEYTAVGLYLGGIPGITDQYIGEIISIPAIEVYELEEERPYRIKNIRWYILINALM